MIYTRLTPKTFVLALLMGLPIVAPHAAHAATDGAVHLRYEAKWGGLHVADFTLSLLNGGETYENRFHLETRGLTRYFTNMGVTAKSVGRIIQPPAAVDNGYAPPASATSGTAADAPLAETYLASHYRTEYTNKKHFRWVDITFNQAPEPAKAVTGTSPIPGREDNWNPAEKGPEVLEKVEPEQRIGVNDPITLIPQMIAVVRNHLLGGPKTGVVKGFDGRRRFDMRITYMGPATRTVAGARHETYRVRIDPQPVAGFKERHRILWNNSAYDFYLSRDGSFLPLQIVPVKNGPVLTLVAECPTECELKAEEEE
ncbi:DUF3108 domain-containing protein [Magnetovibrio sp.]|uniref:DUF3108 domain-containing protein n=1 Tax=Magnetovibrio sp. TaxID=2024836 RepID=UPI002F933169